MLFSQVSIMNFTFKLALVFVIYEILFNEIEQILLEKQVKYLQSRSC